MEKDVLNSDRLNIMMKNLKIANNYIWEMIKFCDYLIKLNGKVNDVRKENSSEK